MIKSDSGTTVATPYAESVSREGYGASSGWKYWEYAFTQAGKFQIEARVQNAGPSYCPGCTVMGLDDVKTSIAGPDTTPPETYITSGPGSYTTSTSVSFGFSSNEKGSTFECRLTRAGASNLALSEVLEDWTDCTSPRSYSNLDYTYYTFQVRATDPAGNVDPTPAGQFWTSGATRQSFTITSPGNNSYDTDGSFSVSGNAPAGSTVELFEGTTSRGTTKADSSSGAWSIALSGLSEGAHTYTARATDAAGNTSSASNSVSVTVDKSAPKVDSVVPQEDATRVARGVDVTATFSEGMQAASVKSSFKLYKKGTTTALTASVSYDAESRKATLNPFGTSTTLLTKGVTYKAVVSTGAKDLAGNSLDQDESLSGSQQKVWFFTVG